MAVGEGGVTVLANGNPAVSSSSWNNGAVADAVRAQHAPIDASQSSTNGHGP